MGKHCDAGKDWGQEEKGMAEDEMAGWHHWVNGHEFEKTLGEMKDRETWCAAVSWVAKSRTWLSDWTTTTIKKWSQTPHLKCKVIFIHSFLALCLSPLGLCGISALSLSLSWLLHFLLLSRLILTCAHSRKCVSVLWVCMCLCVCVCEREREREMEIARQNNDFLLSL